MGGDRGIWVAAASVVLAGCANLAPAAEGPLDAAPTVASALSAITILTDAAGDATDTNSRYARSVVPCAQLRDVALPTGTTCAPVRQGLDGLPDIVGVVPADPSSDLIELRFQETPHAIEIFLDVAALSADLAGASNENASTIWSVTWLAAGCQAIVALWPVHTYDAIDMVPYFIHQCPNTTEPGNVVCAWYCLEGLAFDLSFGSPATIHWTLPRAYLAAYPTSTRLESIRASATSAVLGASNEDLTRTGIAFTGRASGAVGGGASYERDWASAEQPFAFQSLAAAVVPPRGPLRLVEEDMHFPSDPPMPELRFVALDWKDDPGWFHVGLELEEVSESPANQTIAGRLAMGSFDLWMGVRAVEGERFPFGNARLADGTTSSIPIRITVEPGTPGRVVIDVDRADLPPMLAGTPIGSLYALAMYDARDQTDAAGVGSVATRLWAIHDGTALLSSHALATDPSAFAGEGIRLHDETGDVDAPVDLTASTELYDVTGLDVSSVDPGELRISLSIVDLGEMRPPDGYDAAFYAVAFEHERGATMVGHYRSTERPAGEFFCAPDSTVLQAEPGDPTLTTWTTIPGLVLGSSIGSGTETGGVAGNAALVFYAPATCFGLPRAADVLEATNVKAGTYLIRRPAVRATSATVVALDTIEGEEPVALAFLQEVRPPVPWWDAPFGVDRFWDVLGVFLAVFTVAATAVIFLRRRRAFHRYLDGIRDIHIEYAADPQKRAVALVELRRRLHDELERHTISDSHYPIVLDRLRSRLTSARLTSLGAAYYGLPPALALRIERLLDDGHLSGEEAGILEPLVRNAGLDEATTMRLLDRLATWVREDAESLAA